MRAIIFLIENLLNGEMSINPIIMFMVGTIFVGISVTTTFYLFSRDYEKTKIVYAVMFLVTFLFDSLFVIEDHSSIGGFDWIAFAVGVFSTGVYSVLNTALILFLYYYCKCSWMIRNKILLVLSCIFLSSIDLLKGPLALHSMPIKVAILKILFGGLYGFLLFIFIRLFSKNFPVMIRAYLYSWGIAVLFYGILPICCMPSPNDDSIYLTLWIASRIILLYPLVNVMFILIVVYLCKSLYIVKNRIVLLIECLIFNGLPILLPMLF